MRGVHSSTAQIYTDIAALHAVKGVKLQLDDHEHAVFNQRSGQADNAFLVSSLRQEPSRESGQPLVCSLDSCCHVPAS